MRIEKEVLVIRRLCLLLASLLAAAALAGCQPGANGTAGASSKTSAATATPAGPGWVLVETKYFVPDIDVDVLGGPVRSSMTGGGTLLDTYQDSGSKGDIKLSHVRTDEGGGTVFASVQWEIVWSDPAAWLPGGQTASFEVEHKVIEAKTWTPPALTAIFDMPDMGMGRSSSSPNRFHQPNGSQGTYSDTREQVSGMKATMTTELALPTGKAGDRRAIYINFGDGYGMRYTYEWK
jgi:hypothetical protein